MGWRRFDKCKPEKNGWYQCTICFKFDRAKSGEPIYDTYVMDLYWYGDTQRFIDNRAKHGFMTYDVYGYTNGSKKRKLHYSPLIDRTDDVVAWKELPKPYLIKGRRYYNETNTTRKD